MFTPTEIASTLVVLGILCFAAVACLMFCQEAKRLARVKFIAETRRLLTVKGQHDRRRLSNARLTALILACR